MLFASIRLKPPVNRIITIIKLIVFILGSLLPDKIFNISFLANRLCSLGCVISYLPKATVQAALGSIPLSLGVVEGNLILALAVMSICVSAPLGLLLIRRFGSRLLGSS
jgi:hypothetical protein